MAATVALYELTRPIGWRPHDRPHRAAPAGGRGGDRCRGGPPTGSRRCACATSGARPSCPTCCAASPSCRPRSAARSAARPTRRARRSRRSSTRAAASSTAAELDARLAADRVDVTLPGDPPQPVGHLHLLTATRREIEDVFVGLGFSIAEGPEIETVHYNFDALNHDPAHPARAETDTFYVADDVAAHAHLAGAGARDGGPAAAAVHHHPRSRLPPRLRRHPHALSFTRSRASPSTRASPSPTSRARCSPSPARSSARSARSACARTSSPSPSRASRSTSPAS